MSFNAMVGFGDASQWMKLALIFSALCLLLHLAAIDTPGWADDPGVKCGSNASCGREWYAGTEACEVIGMLCSIVSLVLVVCCVWMEDLRHRKSVHFCIIGLSFVGGVAMIIGIIIYGVHTTGHPYSILLTVLAGVCALLCGVFELVHVVVMTTQ